MDVGNISSLYFLCSFGKLHLFRIIQFSLARSLALFLSLCVYVLYECVCICPHVCAYPHTGTSGGPSSIAPPPHLLRQSLSPNVKPAFSVILAGQQSPKTCLSLPPSTEVQINAAIPSFYVGAEDLDSRAHFVH